MRDRRYESNAAFASFDPDRLWAGHRPASDIADAQYVGTAGRDRITGTDEKDKFDLSQGGDDVVHGAGGGDRFSFGATFTGADRVDGGDRHDIVILKGDYSAGITLHAKTLVNVEELDLKGGSYTIAGVGFDDPNGLNRVDATALTAGQSLHLRPHGGLCDVSVWAGAGDDILDMSRVTFRTDLSGGDGNDVMTASGGWLYGGAGNDTLTCVGVNGHANLYGNEGDDSLVGGTFNYFNELNGGAGVDTIAANSESAEISYYTTSDSTSAAYDTITKFDGWFVFAFDTDTTKAGVQHDFHLGATPGHIGDIVVHYDAGLNQTIVDAFTDGDAVADFSVHLIGNVPLTLDDFKADVF